MHTTQSVLKIFGLLVVLLNWFSCGEKTCDEGNKPTAVFQADIPGVLSHSFLLDEKSGEALETLSLEDGFYLELWQSDCQTTRQEFRFDLPRPQKLQDEQPSLPQVADLAAAQFHRLNLLGPSYRAFEAWAQTISAHREAFRRGRPLEVQTGITISLDAISSPEKLTVVVRLEQVAE